MKKLLALMLAAALALSLVACGGGGGTGETNTPSTGNGNTASTDTPSGGSNTPTVNPKDILTSTKWVPLYGSMLVLNDDNTMMMGDNSGTWSLDGTCLTLIYTAKNGMLFEVYADIVEENSITVLKFRRDGKRDGNAETFFIDDHYPENKVDEIKAPMVRKLGDTASSDIMEVTVKKASLALFAASPETSTNDGRTVNIDTAYEPTDNGLY